MKKIYASQEQITSVEGSVDNSYLIERAFALSVTRIV